MHKNVLNNIVFGVKNASFLGPFANISLMKSYSRNLLRSSFSRFQNWQHTTNRKYLLPVEYQRCSSEFPLQCVLPPMYPTFTAVCTARRAVCLHRTVGYYAGTTHYNGNRCYISDTLPAVVLKMCHLLNIKQYQVYIYIYVYHIYQAGCP